MHTQVFGCAAVGFVWGSLAGVRVFGMKKQFTTALAICTATLATSAEVLFLTGWKSVPAFFAAAIFGLITQLSWLYWLKVRVADQWSFR